MMLIIQEASRENLKIEYTVYIRENGKILNPNLSVNLFIALEFGTLASPNFEGFPYTLDDHRHDKD